MYIFDYMTAEELNKKYKGKSVNSLNESGRIPSKEEYLRQIYNNGVYASDEFSAMMDEAIEKHCTD